MSTSRSVSQYVADFAACLDGPTRWRRRVVAEIEDGLDCALAEAGWPNSPDPRALERRVVREWGCPETLAVEFNAISLGLRSSILARRILVATPVLAIGWASVVLFSPVDPWDHEPTLVHVLARVLGISVITALLGVLGILSRSRRVVGVGRPSVELSVVVAGLVVAEVDLFVMLLYRNNAAEGAISWSLAVWPAALSLLLLSVTARDVYRVMVAGRALRLRPAATGRP